MEVAASTQLLGKLNAKTISRIAKMAEKIIQRKLTRDEVSRILQIAKALPADVLRSHSISEMVMVLASKVATELDKPGTQIDVHEMLKDQIGVREENDVNLSEALRTNESELMSIEHDNVSGLGNIDEFADVTKLLGSGNLYDAVALFNPKALQRKAYLSFDSRYPSEASADGKRLTWNFMNNANISQGSINYPRNIKNIVSMKLLNLYLFTNFPIITSSNRFSLFIEEFSAQSFLAPNGKRFHFMMIPARVQGYPGYAALPATNGVMEEPMNFGEFSFRKPFTAVDRMTLVVGRPYEPLAIGKPVVFSPCVVTAPGVFDVVITTPTPLGLTIGQTTDYAITDFTTSDPVADALWITNMQTQRFATVTSANTLLIQLNIFLSPGLPVGVPTTCTLTIAGTILVCDIELTYLEPSTDTNF